MLRRISSWSGRPLAALAAVLLLSGPQVLSAPNVAADGPPPLESIFGVWDANLSPGSPTWQFMVQSGARVVRTPFAWNLIETSPGNYDWSRYDGVFAELKKAGMTPLPIVSNAPAGFGYTPGVAICGPLTPKGLDAFERFMTAAMERYGSRSTITATRNSVVYWQIYNEADFYLKDLAAPDGDIGALGGGCLGNTTNPYNPSEGPTNWGPALYVEVLKRATNAKNAADPNAKIVFAALAADGCYDATKLDSHGRPLAVDDIAKNPFNCRFFAQVLDAGGAPYFDLAAFNSYLFYRWNHETPSAPGFLGKIERFRDVLRDAAVGSPNPALFNKPIAIVETGLAYGQDTRPCTLPNNTACVDFTPDDPALLVAPILAQSLQGHTAPGSGLAAPVDLVIWFALNTEKPTSAGDWGLVYQGKPTQAYLAYQYATSQLRGFAFLNDFGEATMTGGTRPVGGSEPCVGDPTKTRRCNSLQWLAFSRADGLQRHVIWVDSGYPREPHAWKYANVNGLYVATPLEREVGFPIVPGETLTVTSDIGVVLQPHRQESGYAYFKATHRAIFATIKPAAAQIGQNGGTVQYTPPPPSQGPNAPPPPPAFQGTFLPGSVPAGATIFIVNSGAPDQTPRNAPSLGAAFTLGCTTPSGEPCDLNGPATLTFDISQFANATGSYSLGLYKLVPGSGVSALSSDTWVKVGTLTCDTTTKKCTGAIASFGTFAVLDERSFTFIPLATDATRP
ncbi:MAG: hypothetical protein KatS3mg060_3527 [Dehalococcoidia bacterium]|nr:MAG: hypothetical protein KatS3mg060_3527 [Dehalococcoidia bacterium]